MTSWLDDGLSARRVLVTGAAGGIGAAVAGAFRAAGASVVSSDLAVAAIDGPAVEADLSVPGEAQHLARRAAEMLGGLDVVAHIAGLLQRQDLAAVTEESWDRQHAVNLRSSFFLLRSAGEIMASQGRGGRLIATASQSWWTGGYAGSVVYAASKGGVVSMCRGLARTYGPHSVTVNTVAPGAISTPMLTRDLDEAGLAHILAGTPLGRLGTPEEVAGAVLFLASERAGFITGATINVSGGWLSY